MKLIFATSNRHKLEEIRAIVPQGTEITGLSDIGFKGELPETRNTIKGNAIQKAEALFGIFRANCFAEDTGLEIDALHGAPGVHSARYAGDDRDSIGNMQKVLLEMQGVKERSARFRTVIALILDQQMYTFEGIVEGDILESPRGTGGFGYDPIFMPKGYTKSFGELPSNVKNQISHRARATEKLICFLESIKEK